jgi:hypothetical protein
MCRWLEPPHPRHAPARPPAQAYAEFKRLLLHLLVPPRPGEAWVQAAAAGGLEELRPGAAAQLADVAAATVRASLGAQRGVTWRAIHSSCATVAWRAFHSRLVTQT